MSEDYEIHECDRIKQINKRDAKEGWNESIEIIRSNVTEDIVFYTILYEDKNGNKKSITSNIDFCPRCGKKLKE